MSKEYVVPYDPDGWTHGPSPDERIRQHRQLAILDLAPQDGQKRRVVVELLGFGRAVPEIVAATLQCCVQRGGLEVWQVERQLDPACIRFTVRQPAEGTLEA